MTDTNTLAPTDAEILDAAEDFRSQYMHGGTTFDEFDEIGYTRAVLAKWGAPAPASPPFAYEFSRSNGDGTHSEHIERGRLQEVAPGRWEHSGLPRGALADKPIKELYTAPQTQPVAVPAGMEPVAHVSQETFNDDGTSDIIIPALPIGMAIYAAPQPAAQALDSVRVFWQQHTKSDALSMTMAELHDDVELVIRAARGAAQAAPRNGALAAAAQAATAKQSPHPEYDKGFSDGWNRCEERQAAAPASSKPAAGVAT